MRSTGPETSIADAVRAAMALRRVDQAEIGKVLGKSQSSISDRLNGKTEFRVSELRAIAIRLDVPLEQLLAPAAEVSA
jgi:transcriptional regulator with XRE-family HTH domain